MYIEIIYSYRKIHSNKMIWKLINESNKNKSTYLTLV